MKNDMNEVQFKETRSKVQKQSKQAEEFRNQCIYLDGNSESWLQEHTQVTLELDFYSSARVDITGMHLSHKAQGKSSQCNKSYLRNRFNIVKRNSRMARAGIPASQEEEF